MESLPRRSYTVIGEPESVLRKDEIDKSRRRIFWSGVAFYTLIPAAIGFAVAFGIDLTDKPGELKTWLELGTSAALGWSSGAIHSIQVTSKADLIVSLQSVPPGQK
mgnify:CR=1 FL=1